MEGIIRKRSPRKGANICPTCGTTMRMIFVSKDVGGFMSIPDHAACPKCKNVKKLVYQEVEELIVQRVMKTTATDAVLEKSDVPQASVEQERNFPKVE